MLTARQKHAAAEEAYREGLEQATEVRLRIIEVRALAGKAVALRENGDPEGAISLFHTAIERAEDAGLHYRAEQVRAQLK